MSDKRCISCKIKITNDTGATSFTCPNCGKHEIVRCKGCRKTAAKYRCPECNFEGPN
ncbi:MAG: zinc finger domain-containing protein [Nanoarchaeota archaeon]|nr:zinc finger domain-containing protein [Nanoarchaeota archaeon]